MTLITDYAFSGFDQAVVVDVETTGLDPDSDRIVSIAALKADFSKLKPNDEANIQFFQARLNPQIPIPDAASNIHGITDADVHDEESFSDIAQSLHDFIGDLPIIGHNIQFDKRFLSAEFKRAGMKSLYRKRSYCTMKRLRDHYRMIGENVRNPKLEDAAELFKIESRKGKLHDAMEDAMIALKVAVALYDMDSNQSLVQKPENKKAYYKTNRRGPERHYEPNNGQDRNAREEASGKGRLILYSLLVVVLLVLFAILA